ncbi:MAG TPA: restriction endonuclease subunit S [Bacteroidia bacterium]|nr:restriction endonuclease subunit S [Bacteroidia bacterium]
MEQLGTYIDVILGGTPQTKKLDYWNGEIPWASVVDFVNDKYLFVTEKTITQKGLDNSNTKLLDIGDIIVSARGTVGKTVVCKVRTAFNQSCYALRSKDKEVLDQSYLYYLLQFKILELKTVATGGVFDTIIKSTLENLKFKKPLLPTQQRIASILSAYDDLIEVNNQRIKLLEETARELYKEWFVRMRFPEYKKAKFKKGIPTDWRIEPIGNVIDYHIGGGWGNDNKDNQFSVAGYVIRGTDIPKVRAGQANQDVYRFHKASNMKSRELIEGDIVFETAGGSEGQPLGRTCYITQEMLDAYGDKVMAASFCKQIRTTSIPSLYLYYFLNYLYDTGMIEAYQVQSTGISNYQFEPFLKFQQIILPKDELMESFHDKAILMQKQIAILGQQNTQLRQIRDRLLPRLISGKLEVKI